jgi:hypothetical protein
MNCRVFTTSEFAIKLVATYEFLYLDKQINKLDHQMSNGPRCIGGIPALLRTTAFDVFETQIKNEHSRDVLAKIFLKNKPTKSLIKQSKEPVPSDTRRNEKPGLSKARLTKFIGSVDTIISSQRTVDCWRMPIPGCQYVQSIGFDQLTGNSAHSFSQHRKLKV